jgi:hypothetical protein
MAAGPAHKPVVLYHASTERRDAAQAAYDRKDWVLAMYLGGLAVESILQAIALLDDPTHDAKHDLPKWLARCRTSLQKAIKGPAARDDWSLIVRVWRNDLRYLSREGMLGYVRQFQDLVRGIRGGPDAIMRSVADRVLQAATTVHSKGVVAWSHYARK